LGHEHRLVATLDEASTGRLTAVAATKYESDEQNGDEHDRGDNN
jgi:hypothetical protein